MKRYATTYSNGHTVESSSAHEANNWTNYGDGQRFFVFGKEMLASDFYAAVRDAVEVAYAKKCETHVKVRVRYGSSAASYVNKWIKK